jgi:hypothetical protein
MRPMAHQGVEVGAPADLRCADAAVAGFAPLPTEESRKREMERVNFAGTCAVFPPMREAILQAHGRGKTGPNCQYAYGEWLTPTISSLNAKLPIRLWRAVYRSSSVKPPLNVCNLFFIVGTLAGQQLKLLLIGV